MGFDFGFDEGDIYLNELRIYRDHLWAIRKSSAQIKLCNQLEEDHQKFVKLVDLLYAIPPIDMNGTAPKIFEYISYPNQKNIDNLRRRAKSNRSTSIDFIYNFSRFFEN
ncbi:hypothetical protein [Pelobacter seleniigenes]|uniref:hypothetical protein n=1 Tax=Pelobacter seleniigenes TaxID=407188 RepID=UPI001FDF7F82|nr:hypothetical protein [Pelobacter seleniigenes]